MAAGRLRTFLTSFLSIHDAPPSHVLFPRACVLRLCVCVRRMGLVLISCLAVENAVGDAGGEPAEAEGQRAGAEGHEEGDGGDEGQSAEFCLCWAAPNFS